VTLFSQVVITNTVLLVIAPIVAGLLRPAGGRHFDPRFALVAGIPLLFLWGLICISCEGRSRRCGS
jgi:hypothetical protein